MRGRPGITMGCTALTVLICEEMELFTTGERYALVLFLKLTKTP